MKVCFLFLKWAFNSTQSGLHLLLCAWMWKLLPSAAASLTWWTERWYDKLLFNLVSYFKPISTRYHCLSLNKKTFWKLFVSSSAACRSCQQINTGSFTKHVWTLFKGVAHISMFTVGCVLEIKQTSPYLFSVCSLEVKQWMFRWCQQCPTPTWTSMWKPITSAFLCTELQ